MSKILKKIQTEFGLVVITEASRAYSDGYAAGGHARFYSVKPKSKSKHPREPAAWQKGFDDAFNYKFYDPEYL